MFSKMHFKLKCLGLLVCVLDNNVKKKILQNLSLETSFYKDETQSYPALDSSDVCLKVFYTNAFAIQYWKTWLSLYFSP